MYHEELLTQHEAKRCRRSTGPKEQRSGYLGKLILHAHIYIYICACVYVFDNEWSLLGTFQMLIANTCFAPRLLHNGSQGQHLVNRFKLHEDSLAVQWMQKSDGHPTLGPQSEGNQGPSHTKSPPVYFCKTSSWKPPPSSLLSLFISSSWTETGRSALVWILCIDPKMGQLTKPWGNLVCFQQVSGFWNKLCEEALWVTQGHSTTAMPTHTHTHARI